MDAQTGGPWLAWESDILPCARLLLPASLVPCWSRAGSRKSPGTTFFPKSWPGSMSLKSSMGRRLSPAAPDYAPPLPQVVKIESYQKPSRHQDFPPSHKENGVPKLMLFFLKTRVGFLSPSTSMTAWPSREVFWHGLPDVPCQVSALCQEA